MTLSIAAVIESSLYELSKWKHSSMTILTKTESKCIYCRQVLSKPHVFVAAAAESSSVSSFCLIIKI